MAGSLLRSRLDPSDRALAEGMDDMDPQMFTVLAARVAIERLDSAGHERRKRPQRGVGFIPHLTRRFTAPVTDRIVARRSPAATRDAAAESR